MIGSNSVPGHGGEFFSAFSFIQLMWFFVKFQTTSGADQPFYLNDAETVTSDHLRSSDMRSLEDNVKVILIIQVEFW